MKMKDRKNKKNNMVKMTESPRDENRIFAIVSIFPRSSMTSIDRYSPRLEGQRSLEAAQPAVQ